MKTVVRVQTMRDADRATIEGGVSSKELMLRAGKAIFESHDFIGKTAIVCGKGNNAGDGYVLALLLQDSAHLCVLFLIENVFSDDGEYYFNQCKEKNIPIRMMNAKTDLSEFNTVVDCIFGTGFKGVPKGKYKEAIECINRSGAFVLSVDCNSGINGDNGQGECFVKSDLTIGIGALKTGYYLGKGKDCSREYRAKDIGIAINNNIFVAEDTDFSDFIKERENDTHKGRYGYVGLMGGCENYVGAVKLAALSLSALRAGCGVSKLLIADNILPYVARVVMESTLYPLQTGEDGSVLFREESLDEGIKNLRSLAVGMGWGRGKDYKKIIEYLLEHFSYPLIIDADGLNALSENPDLLFKKNGTVVLTPHLGEMSRLTGVSVEEISSDPIQYASVFANRYDVIVLLKGATTVVTDGKTTFLVSTGCAGMATAGSGDVLSGILAGVLGQGFENKLLSVVYAAYLNGMSGQFAQKEMGDIAMISSDTVRHIPEAIAFLRSK